MASRNQQYPTARGMAPRIQTQAQTNQRFSYAQTPQQMARSTFERFPTRPSPTNSTIDESPLSPISQMPWPKTPGHEIFSPDASQPEEIHVIYQPPEVQGLYTMHKTHVGVPEAYQTRVTEPQLTAPKPYQPQVTAPKIYQPQAYAQQTYQQTYQQTNQQPHMKTSQTYEQPYTASRQQQSYTSPRQHQQILPQQTYHSVVQPTHEQSPPQHLHPALSAPYADPSPIETQPATPFLRPPSPTKTPRPQTTLPYSSADHKPLPYTPPTPLTPVTPSYTPYSLSGPNGPPSIGHHSTTAFELHQPGQSTAGHADSKWRHGLCEMDGLCCLGVVCPCVVYGKVQYRLGQKSSGKEATDLIGFEWCNGSCGLWAVACGLQWLLTSIQRARVRKQYHIDGSIGDDCMTSLCCCCCVLMQNEREVRAREELARSGGSLAAKAYMLRSEADGMRYDPPPR